MRRSCRPPHALIRFLDDGTLELGTNPVENQIGPIALTRKNAHFASIEVSSRSRLRHVEGLDDYGQINGVIEALGKRGYTDADIAKILGENLLRVFRRVWGG